jgi:hypothetical protein
MKRQFTFTLLILLLCNGAIADGEKTVLTRVYTGPILGFYNNNEDYTANTKALFSFTVGMKWEYKFNGLASLGIGAEYVSHGLAFDSYYFAPGQQTFYDKTFPFVHKARLHEAHAPILFKYNFTKENDTPMNGYLMVGWGYRYIFASNTTITSKATGDFAYVGNIQASMEYKLFTRNGGSMLLGGIGFERNFQVKHTSIYMELLYKYGLSRFRYNGSGTADPFYIKDAFLSVNMGYKF